MKIKLEKKDRFWIIALILVSLALFVTASETTTEWKPSGDGGYEKWEKTETIDLKEYYDLKDELVEMTAELEAFKKDKNIYLNTCMAHCPIACEDEYNMVLFDFESFVDVSREKVESMEGGLDIEK